MRGIAAATRNGACIIGPCVSPKKDAGAAAEAGGGDRKPSVCAAPRKVEFVKSLSMACSPVST